MRPANRPNHDELAQARTAKKDAQYLNRYGEPMFLEDENGCWVWQGTLNPKGYGGLRRDYQTWLAHRWVYTREIGPIPPGYDLDHRCKEPACVNPDHLEAVLPEVNHLRGSRRKLTPGDVIEIRARAAAMDGSINRKAAALADDYPVTQHTLWMIIAGRIWSKQHSPRTSRRAA
jgi:hypothetical protein